MKTSFLAVLVAVVFAGCGEGDVRSGAQSAAQVDPSADYWAEQAFGIYGEAAVRACLAGFHGDLPASARDSASNYRTALAEYMCFCARGQSEVPCPQP